MRKAALHNLGCKVNSYETEAMQQLLEAAGYQIVDFEEKADVYIINTCSVTNVADKKSRQMLHRAKAKNPEALVVAAGCYAQAAGEKLLEDTAIDLVIGNNKKGGSWCSFWRSGWPDRSPRTRSLIFPQPRNMKRSALNARQTILGPLSRCRTDATSSAAIASFPTPGGGSEAAGRRTWRRRSGTWAEKGYQEIVLTGIHLSSYGTDFRRSTRTFWN